ncbi:MAG TPA: ABC transporter ATP-binding protein [Candidatus Limnocylindria bacterium]|nr:ABC transporter ATP-binding protein [Candidatus Limnocylindria bacterium]
MAILELEHVSYAYGGGASALDDVSLAIAPGVVGLLGANAAGKTTLVRIAAGLLPPARGRVLLDGRDLASVGRAGVARRVAIVPQSASLPPAFTVLELVLMGRTPYLGLLAPEGARDLAIAERALERVDARALADRRLGELSGGERQRALVARALAQETDILLLDEPTAHLDLAHQTALLDLALGLAREQGLVVLAALHDVNLAAAYCDELAFLSRGRVIARGAPRDVLSASTLRDAYGLSFALIEHPETGRPVALLPAPGHGA